MPPVGEGVDPAEGFGRGAHVRGTRPGARTGACRAGGPGDGVHQGLRRQDGILTAANVLVNRALPGQGLLSVRAQVRPSLRRLCPVEFVTEATDRQVGCILRV